MGDRSGGQKAIFFSAAVLALIVFAGDAGIGRAQPSRDISPRPKSAQATPPAAIFGAYHALVIGNQAYRHLPSLATPVADARTLADLLKREYGFQNVRLLTNSTRTEMVRALDDMRNALGPIDNLLIYYAGHGWLDREADRGYWLPVDAERDTRANWLSNADLTDTLRATKAKHVVIVADSCYSGTLTRNIGIQPLGSPEIMRLAQKKARTVLTSGGLEPVADVGGGGHSVFAKAFLNALSNNSGIADLTTLFSTIRRQVLLNAEQTPQYADIRQTGHDGGDFIFVRRGAQVAAVAPPPQAPPPGPTITKEVVKEYGSLAIRGRLTGIEVWLGDQKIGETESGSALVLNDLAAGSYRLKARKRGHKEWERDVEVAANQRAEVMIDIEPLRPEPPKAARGEDGAEMVLVPAGEFVMGSEDYDDEKPRHRVYLDAFYVDKFELTNALFERFVRSTGHQTTAEREGWAYALTGSKWDKVNGAAWKTPQGPGSSADTSHPVIQVSWQDADAYCRWAGKRLPTEAEWEKAAHGTDGRKYPWGEQWDASRANSSESKLGRTTPVGSYASGASPYGAHDMAGNVWEWVADWYDKDYYKRSPERNPQGPDSGTSRVLRGGSWYNGPVNLRTAYRYYNSPDYRGDGFGFRCARGLQ